MCRLVLLGTLSIGLLFVGNVTIAAELERNSISQDQQQQAAQPTPSQTTLADATKASGSQNPPPQQAAQKTSAGAAAQVSPPPDVQAIVNKMKAGQELTAAEQQRFQQWTRSMSQMGTGSAGGSSSSGATDISGTQRPPSMPCPPAKATALPTNAGGADDYAELLNNIVNAYGGNLGTTKSAIDEAINSVAAGQSASSAGALLLINGSGAASVYASAVAAQRNPADLDAGNNLAVALDAIPDSPAAAAVLLHIRSLQPSALSALNLGWVYYNSGNTSLARELFQEASRLDPDLSGPDAGLGMLTACGGDQAAALNQFRKSLSKGYSGVVAAAYKNTQDAQGQMSDPEDIFPPSGSLDSSPMPELPVDPDLDRTAAAAASFQHAADFADQRLREDVQTLNDAYARISTLLLKAQQNPDGTIDLPRLFDKQLFEYGEIYRMTLLAAMDKFYPELDSYSAARAKADTEWEASIRPLYQQDSADSSEEFRLEEEKQACHGDSACEAPYVARINELSAEMKEIGYQICLKAKDRYNQGYTEAYKHWKVFSDLLRAGTRDFYAYSQPIIDQIWLPALNDEVQAGRDIQVLNWYKSLSGAAAEAAEFAKMYRALQCVRPSDVPPRQSKDLQLTKKKPNCPFESPLKVGFSGFSIQLGCDKVTISGGELLRFRFERDFVHKETGYWIGVGANVSTLQVDLGGGSGLSSLGFNGKSWTPPGMGGLSLSGTGEIMVGLKLNDSGGLQDLGLTFTTLARGSAGNFGGALGSSESISVENGANIKFLGSYGALPPTISLPLGFSVGR